ncbi:hypothetical protein [Desulfosporosinus sp. SB140]|uniref:hypothetical protein n=1 Tax=Desulfosporosinus paludis TaxID=3115649 RepID=UPI00388EAFAB
MESTGLGRTIDTIKNITDEGSIVDGIKRTTKEDWCEDNPITSKVYQAGRYDGKVEGYEEASDKYESKLLKQADEFLIQKQIFESERGAYEELLDEYDAEIDALNVKLDKSEADKEYLHQLLLREREFRKLR